MSPSLLQSLLEGAPEKVPLKPKPQTLIWDIMHTLPRSYFALQVLGAHALSVCVCVQQVSYALKSNGLRFWGFRVWGLGSHMKLCTTRKIYRRSFGSEVEPGL